MEVGVDIPELPPLALPPLELPRLACELALELSLSVTLSLSSVTVFDPYNMQYKNQKSS